MAVCSEPYHCQLNQELVNKDGCTALICTTDKLTWCACPGTPRSRAAAASQTHQASLSKLQPRNLPMAASRRRSRQTEAVGTATGPHLTVDAQAALQPNHVDSLTRLDKPPAAACASSEAVAESNVTNISDKATESSVDIPAPFAVAAIGDHSSAEVSQDSPASPPGAGHSSPGKAAPSTQPCCSRIADIKVAEAGCPGPGSTGPGTHTDTPKPAALLQQRPALKLPSRPSTSSSHSSSNSRRKTSPKSGCSPFDARLALLHKGLPTTLPCSGASRPAGRGHSQRPSTAQQLSSAAASLPLADGAPSPGISCDCLRWALANTQKLILQLRNRTTSMHGIMSKHGVYDCAPSGCSLPGLQVRQGLSMTVPREQGKMREARC